MAANSMTGPAPVAAGCLPAGAVVLGQFSAAHLGDTLCTSALPRLIREQLGKPVYVADHPMLRAVFAHNPHVGGFVGGAGDRLDAVLCGAGHVTQRMEQGLGLRVRPVPKPEIYLADAERTWAESLRRRWPAGRPVCVLSSGAVTDSGNAGRVHWGGVARVLGEGYTVVQPVLSERPVPGAVVLRGLSLREYFALVSVADALVGATSGGSHVAAAFDVPALVVGWRALLDPWRFPSSVASFPAAFLYPQQWHLAAEDLAAGAFREPRLREVLAEMAARGRLGRAEAVAAPPGALSAPAPAAPRTVVRAGKRFVRVAAAMAG